MDPFFRLSPDLIYLMTPADKEALLTMAARRRVLPAFKAVEAARFLPTQSDDVLRVVMEMAGVDVHHAAKIAAFCPFALNADPLTPKIAFLKDIARRLAETGKQVPSAYRPDPSLLIRWNGASPIPDPRYRSIPHIFGLDPLPTPIRLVETDDRDAQMSAAIAELVRLFQTGAAPDDIRIVNATPADLRKLALLARTYGFSIEDDSPIRLDRLPLFAAFRAACQTMKPADALAIMESDEGNRDEAAAAAIGAIASILAKYPSDVTLEPALIDYEGASAILRRPRVSNVVMACGLDRLTGYGDEHVLVLNYTDDLFPAVRIDDDYLTDVEKASLSLETSTERNERVRTALGRAVGSLEHVVLFRPLKADGSDTRPAAVLEGVRPVRTERFTAERVVHSPSTGLLAYAKERHDELAYGLRTAALDRLAARFKGAFREYDPAFRPLSRPTRDLLASRRVSLSATSLETFNRCRFRFLCDHLLRLAPYESTVSQELGNLAHKALRDAFADGVPAARAASIAPFDHCDPRLDALAAMLASRLEKVEAYLRERAKTVAEYAHELECSYTIEGRPGFVVKGTIDRITYYDRADGRYVFVIDYKTGSPSFSREDFEKGTDLQPVFYLHLLEKSGAMPSFVPAGFYYQPVTLGRLVRSDKKDMVSEALKQEGLTLAERDAVAAAGGPEALRNVRLKDDGTFYENAAVADREELRAMIRKIDGFIALAVDAVLSGAYAINPEPRKPGGTSASCEYCQNRGICYSVDRIAEIDDAAQETEAE